jgi:hypothetical protein
VRLQHEHASFRQQSKAFVALFHLAGTERNRSPRRKLC